MNERTQTTKTKRFSSVSGVIFSLGFALATPVTVLAQDVSPPQGYVGISQDFGNNAPAEFDDLEYRFRFETFGMEQAGTFWANDFTFVNSENNLLFPDNYVGGQQGGYIGLQKLADGSDLAIFSVFWALDAMTSAPGGTAINDIEMWYLDGDPFNPPIYSLGDVDTSRQTAGGPFSSVRRSVDLTAGVDYALKIAQSGNPGGNWWDADLVNRSAGVTQSIGSILLPDEWGGLNPARVGGFVEHFTAMPEGCDSISGSASTFFSAVSPSSGAKASPNAYVYGACKDNIENRSDVICDSDACLVAVQSLDVPVIPVPLPMSGLLLLGGLAGLRLVAVRARPPGSSAI